MAVIYYKRIKAGAYYQGHIMTIEDVPEKWRAQVERMLAADEEE